MRSSYRTGPLLSMPAPRSLFQLLSTMCVPFAVHRSDYARAPCVLPGAHSQLPPPQAHSATLLQLHTSRQRTLIMPCSATLTHAMGSHQHWRLLLCVLWHVQPRLALDARAGEVEDCASVCSCVLRRVCCCLGGVVEHGAWDEPDIPVFAGVAGFFSCWLSGETQRGEGRELVGAAAAVEHRGPGSDSNTC